MQSMGMINTDRRQQVQTAQQHTATFRAPERASEMMQVAQSNQASKDEAIAKLTEALNYQATQFERFRQITERKFTTLSKDLMDSNMRLKEVYAFVTKIKDKQEVHATREALANYQKGDRKPVDRAIDRNGVSPKDVQIENIFNFSGKRF